MAELKSPCAQSVIRGWARQYPLHSLKSEYAHATERRLLSAANAPGQSWVSHARHDVLARARQLHLDGKGDDPCSTRVTQKQRLEPTITSPIDMLLCDADKHRRAEAVHRPVSHQEVPAARSSVLALQNVQPALALEDAPSHNTVAKFGGAPSQTPSGRGGSPLMTYRNMKLKAASQACQRRLPREEITAIEVASNLEMKNPATKRLYEDLYALEVKERRRKSARLCTYDNDGKDTKPSNYVPRFGIMGCQALPLAPAAMVSHFTNQCQGKFPSDAKVFHSMDNIVTPQGVMDKPGMKGTSDALALSMFCD